MNCKLRFFFVVFTLLFGSFYGFGQKPDSINRLESSLSDDLNDTTKLNTLIKLANFYKSSKATLALANDYADQALLLMHDKKLNDQYKLHWIKAELLLSSEMPSLAIDEMKIVISALKQTNQFQEIAKAQNFLAYATFYSGQFQQAIEIYLANIEFARQNQLKSIIPQAYLGIGNIYNTLKNQIEEKNAIQLYLDEAKKENDTELIARAYSRLGSFYSSVDSNFMASIDAYKQSFSIYKSKNDSIKSLVLSNSIGWNYYLSEQYDSSLYYYYQSVDYAPSKNLPGLTNAYGNIGTIYRDKMDYDKALYYYGLCDESCIKTNDLYNRAWVNKDISDLYISTGDYKEAYQHFVYYKNFSDSLKTSTYNAGLADARTRYQTEAKEKELQLLNLKLIQREYLIYGFAGIVILIIIISFLIIRQFNLIARRKNAELNNKLSEITHANLRQQMNPHFIFNTLNSIQYYMYQHDKLATNNYLTKFSSLIRKILENSQLPFVSIKDELDVIQLYLELEILRFKEKFRFEISVDDEIDTLSYKIPSMLIQPYIENAVCHGLMNKAENGLLTINISLTEHNILCVIEDNGIGREAAMEIKMKKSISHNSLGMKITESRIDISNAIYGTAMKAVYIDLKDNDNRACGTRVELYLPIKS